MREQHGPSYQQKPPRTAYTASIQADEEYEDDEEDDYQPPVRQHRDVQRLSRQPITSYAQPKLPTSTRRYDVDSEGIPVPRRSRVEPHYHDTPYRKPATREAPRFRLHWIAWAGIVLFILVMGYTAFSALAVWWQNHTDDVAYGMPRTYQTDAVVGHNDSSAIPSHFICTNLRGKVSVLEAPGGDYTLAIDYPIVINLGNTATPCTVNFTDVNADGKPDMAVTIGDPGNTSTFYLFNTGKKFSAKG
jgi:hypothetical protein